MKVTKYYISKYKDGEKKGQQASYLGVINGVPGENYWHLEVFLKRADGSFTSQFKDDFDHLYHAEGGLRKFRSGLKWEKVK